MTKWAYSINQKHKIALLLVIVLGAILLTNIMERNNVSALDKSFSSMYEDRLLPATYIFNITDHLYQKRLLWENKTANGISNSEQLMDHNTAIYCLLEDFENTFLVAEEKKALENFKTDLHRYNLSEAELIRLAEEADITAEDKMKLNNELHALMNDLNLLSTIQVETAKELKSESRSTIDSNTILSHFEIAMLIVVGVVINIIILSSRSIAAAMKRDTVRHWQN